MLLLTMLACSNVDEHAWSAGGTHYATGEMYSPGIDTAAGDDTAGGDDTASGDTAAGTFSPTSGPTCAFEEQPNIGDTITCTASFFETDALALDGGTVILNLDDSTNTTILSTALDISSTGGDGAQLDETEVMFYIQDIDTAETYTLRFLYEQKEGATTEEFEVSI